MSSLDEYQDLGKSLSQYVKEARTNSGAAGLQEAFKPGGKLSDAMQMLDQKEKLIRSYEQELRETLDQNSPEGISLDYVNKKVAENKIELEEIKLLKDRLADLSSAVSQGTSRFATTRAVNEFSEGIEKHEKVSKGFFSTLTSFIGNIFKGKDEQKLAQALGNLDDKTNAIRNESQERFSIPGKGKDSPEIPQPEQVISKEMSSQSLSESRPPNYPPPPIPTKEVDSPLKAEVIGAPPPPPMGLGQKEVDSPLKAEVIGVPPPPPPAPPPPPMGLAPKGQPKEIIQEQPKKDLLAEIREKTVKKKVSLNHPEYEHVSTTPQIEKSSDGLAGVLQKRMGGNKEEIPIEQRLLEGASKKDQQNILYSAMVDNNEKLVADLLNHKSDFNTGVQAPDEDGWDVDVIEKRSTFSAEQIETITKAAEETRIRVAAGIDLVLPEKNPKTVIPAPKEQEVSQVSPTIKVETPPPPPISEIGSGIPPPPPPPPTVEAIKKSTTPDPVVKKDMALLDQIKEGMKLKSVASSTQDQSLNSEEFTYTASKDAPKAQDASPIQGILARRGAIRGEEELEDKITSELEKLSAKDQLNKLYSAVIDGDKTKIAIIVEVGDQEVFTLENMQKIANAAQKVSASQGPVKKTMIESGLKVLAKEANIDLGVGENRSK